MPLVNLIRDRVASRNENRARQSPHTPAYTVLQDGRSPTQTITLGELDTRARAIAAFLQTRCQVGDRALLLYPQGIEAIAAFLGCLYAGVVAVPAPAPETTRLKRLLPRLEAIAADAGAKLVLTSTPVLQAREGWQFTAHSQVQPLNGRPCLWLHYRLVPGRFTESAAQLTALLWIATDKLPNALASQWHAPNLRGDTLAYLQYTSGSTATNDPTVGHHDLSVAVDNHPLLVQVGEIWRQVLGATIVRETDNFFELGGGTLKAKALISELQQRLQINVTLSAIAQASTLKEFVALIDSQAFESQQASSLIAIRTGGTKIPFFYVHGLGGSSLNAKQLLAPHINPARPMYGLNAVGLEGEAEPYTVMEEMAQHYIREIQTVHPHGPYLLGGQCFGGNVAFEMARQLTQQGKTVLLVAMADSLNPIWRTEQKENHQKYWQTTGKIKWQEKLESKGVDASTIEKISKIQQSNYEILKNYSPQKYSGRVVYFSAEENQNLGLKIFDPMQPGGWNDWVEGGVEIVKVPGRHGTYHNPPHVAVYAQKLNACLESVEGAVKYN